MINIKQIAVLAILFYILMTMQGCTTPTQKSVQPSIKVIGSMFIFTRCDEPIYIIIADETGSFGFNSNALKDNEPLRDSVITLLHSPNIKKNKVNLDKLIGAMCV